MEIELQLLSSAVGVPAYAHAGDAGVDLCTTADLTVAPGQRVLAPTGVALAIPDGYAGFIHPRSGLASRHGLTVANAPGTIDSGYRGEISVALVNLDASDPVVLRRGDRIAQLILQRVERVEFRQVERLPDSGRGSQGFGSTGGYVASGNQAGSRTQAASSNRAGSRTQAASGNQAGESNGVRSSA